MRGGAALASVVTLLASLVACGNRPQEPEMDLDSLPASAINPLPREELAEGGTLRWGVNDFPAQWNPHHANGNLSTVATVMDGLLPTPFRTDDKGRAHPDPDYVEEVTVTTEPRQVVTLKLNPEARWSTGDPITWRDYAAMATALSGRGEGYEILGEAGYDRISEVRRGADEFEVVVEFARPFAEYEALFSHLLPHEYTSSPAKFNEGYRETIPVTAGPFEFEEIDPTGQTITVVRDTDWWGEPALLDRIVYRAMAPDALDAAFLDGGIDAYAPAPESGSYARVRDARDSEVRAALAPDYRHITLNGQSPILADVDVRHALFLAIDRTALAAAAFSSIGWEPEPLGNHFLMPTQDGYVDNSGEWAGPDPQRAAELLERAGWTLGKDGGQVRVKDGRELRLTFVVPQGYATAQSEAELVQAMLGEVGIAVDIEAVPGDSLFSEHVLPGDYDLVAFVNYGTGFPVSPSMAQWSDAVTDDSGSPLWRSNVGRIGSPEIDAAMNAALAEFSPEAARERINEADRLLWEAGHTLPLYQRPELVAVREDIANLGAAGFAALDQADIGFVKNG
ncbi:peptide/nickel transport system substrate-binding protein [Marinactinospora thermotolerans DSM 45154]|uniref:Peptide/nickel transport system substrate-binding protein n=1 Tax=Marinactinospora thermotolerans DSM 45154 TaxID=1122192 RepID=A0A1T4LKW0_9ACTN|nr:peptide/nickel transport system substrate-binding protein [Marinactinospora thermotolerans DSM 45154]